MTDDITILHQMIYDIILCRTWLVYSLIFGKQELARDLFRKTNAADKKLYQRQVAAADRQIDALVYDLYGLSTDEMGIVEGEIVSESSAVGRACSPFDL